MLGDRCRAVQANVVLVLKLVAAEVDAGDEHRDQTVGIKRVGEAVDHEHGADDQEPVEFGGGARGGVAAT